MNPLFSDEPFKNEDDNSYVLSRSDKPHARPESPLDNPAVEMIRSKIDALYLNEPSAKQELEEIKQVQPPRSKHQEFKIGRASCRERV